MMGLGFLGVEGGLRSWMNGNDQGGLVGKRRWGEVGGVLAR